MRRAAALGGVLALVCAPAPMQAGPDLTAGEDVSTSAPPVGLVFGRALDIAGQPLRLVSPVRPGAASGATLRYSGPIARPRGIPVRYAAVSSNFGPRIHPLIGTLRFHAGIDLPAPSGTPVHATATGMVTYAGWLGGYGLCVIVDHGGGYTTLFGHLSAAHAALGALVHSGQVLGRVGSTGQSTGPHLHYEVRRDAVPVDPRRYLAS